MNFNKYICIKKQQERGVVREWKTELEGKSKTERERGKRGYT